MIHTLRERMRLLISRFGRRTNRLPTRPAPLRFQYANSATAHPSLWSRQNIGPSSLVFVPPSLSANEQTLVDSFHKLTYDAVGPNGSRSYFVSWLGYGMFKWPTDLWNYQQIISETQPDVIIETGTYRGGSALFLATICDLLGHGQIITIDVDETYRQSVPCHPRITYLHGSSTEPTIVDQVRAVVGTRENVMVILDSDHQRDHVLDELRTYSRFIPRGGHLIVEDTNINGHPVHAEFGPGPWEAVEIFLAENPGFYADRNQERFFLTHNPRGFLRRLAA